MPKFTVTACRMVPSCRETIIEADTAEEACSAALANPCWRDSETGDPDHVGHTFIDSIHEDGDAGADLPIPAHFRNRQERRSGIFGELLAMIDEAAFDSPLPVDFQALIEKARAARDDAPDPEPLDIMTPWGAAEEILVHGEGCVFFSTPSHGGIRLDKCRNREMPEAWRRDDRWYEEDADAHCVVVTFPHLFNADEVRLSREMVARRKARASLPANGL